MPRCSHCGSEVPEHARYCVSCGAVQVGASQLPTAEAATRPGPARRQDRSPSGEAFVPGEILAARYRIVALLGRGGMGEVYRADDLKLGQPVSLKFLPPALAAHAGVLEQFHAEVRNARQVSHPNVCRVYDIGEVDGRHFISMEYVDGEDLAALLRRIGRLPKSKAEDVARQLCAGLAAAHEKGVLHRDLKPSNVMLDGNGRVRITDFGLAIRAEDATEGGIAGTPAYMAPEQFEGHALSEQTDLYALGLVLYEVYTGKRALEASGYAEWKSRHATTPPPSPALLEPGIGDAAERVILRCLEKDPSRRPRSALQVAAALPGGDPLAAALAAGETPSPEMVAAAGGEGGLSRRGALTLLGTIILATGLVMAIAPDSTDLGLARLTRSRDQLRERALESIETFGYGREALDSEAWLDRDYEPMKYLADRMPSTTWRREIGKWGAPVLLLYRQSPRYLVPSRASPLNGPGRYARVDVDDPPFDVPGMVLAVVDGTERLRRFQAVPPQLDSTRVRGRMPDWNPIFAAAGVDRREFTEVLPRWVAPVAFDSLAEWSGTAPWDRDIPLTLTAASWRGRPVYFEMRGPWSRPEGADPELPPGASAIAATVFGALILVVTVAGLYLAQRNIRLGRGDRRGAWRLAIGTWLLSMISWVLGAHHVPEFGSELSNFFTSAGVSFVFAVYFAATYLAIEPFIRRHTPELLIGWARVLEGRFRDARVGRDLLVGAAFGALIALVPHLVNGVPTWFPVGQQTTLPPSLSALSGGRHLVAYLVRIVLNSAAPAILALGAYVLLLIVLRRRILAVAGLILVLMLIRLGAENVVVETAGALLVSAALVLLTVRYGLLAATSGGIVGQMLITGPFPLDPGAANFTQAMIMLGVVAALVLYAFRTSLGSRPIFGFELD